MARWEPDARGRLERAALELFDECGFEETTVEEIAARAGLTKRTFFRYFADKREVLFGTGPEFQNLFVDGLRAAPESATGLDAVAHSLGAAAADFPAPREFARRRHKVIAANDSLRERELVKLASVASALAGALRERGVEEPEASVLAETAIAVFRVAFERWVAEDSGRGLDVHVREALEALTTVVGSTAPARTGTGGMQDRERG
ncbi:MAG TPA: TetR family transcriptional regulator [Solirubrobacter sp.]|nr:TetR family transcriptional regulator [Solirubrobacter sp.]